MADKLQQGVNVLTTFVDGETPTAAKLNSITAQLRNASQQLEKAVGDLHDQSYPYSSSTDARLAAAYGRVNESTALTNASTRSLDIANLARLIGPASILNPQLIAGSHSVTELVPSEVTEFTLKYVPENTGTVSFSKNASGEPFETARALVTGLDAEGDYFVDGFGRVFTTMETDSVDPGTVTYTTDSDDYHGGPNYLGARFNVLPDLNQLSAGGQGCYIGSPPDAQGRRSVTLPAITHAQYNEARDSITLDSKDPNYAEQLLLPMIITDNYAAGELIPDGFLLLKNWTTGEVYDEAEYTYNSTTSVLIGAVDITTEVDRGDEFVLVTVGTDISTSIDDLRRKSRHGHDREFGEPLVPANALSDWTSGPWDSGKGGFTASNIPSNYAPQYLHRYGYTFAEGAWNDRNVMRGHLVVGKTGTGPSDFVAASSGAAVDDTYKLAFGHPNRSYIWDEAGGSFQIYSATAPIDITSANDALTMNGASFTVDTTGGQVLDSGGTFRIDAEDLVQFRFNEQAFYTTCRSEEHFIEDPGAGATQVSFKIAQGSGGGGSDGYFKVASSGHFFSYDDSSYTASVLSHNVDTNRQFMVDCDSTNSETPMLFKQQNASGKGVLELQGPGTAPGDAFFYQRFTDSAGAQGSIRGTDNVGDNVFYSRYGGAERAALWNAGGPAVITTDTAGHVKFVSGGSDYGEWLRAGDPAEWDVYFQNQDRKATRMGLPEGLVVYVREGLFYRGPGGTPMIITNRAIVVGNLREEQWPEEECEVLSFIGQVPVMCHGACKDGDILIPSEDEPGTVVAVDADECTFAQYKRALGTAWSTSEEEGLKYVLCAVGKK